MEGKMKKILLIDDEEGTRALLVPALESFGFSVIVAASAMEGYKIAKSDGIDLILLDLMMPGVSGIELYEVLDLFLKKTKVMVYSAYSVDVQKRIIPHAAGYFDKGMGMDTLKRKLATILNEEDQKTALKPGNG